MNDGVNQLIPCIRDPREAPMAAILLPGRNPFPFCNVLSIYGWVAIFAKIGQPCHV